MNRAAPGTDPSADPAAPAPPVIPDSGRRLGRLRRLYLTLRTEHTTPGKLAAGVGIGVFVGCSPFWGLHLGISVVLAMVFRLNRVLVYAVSNVASIPALFTVFAEIQVGHRVLHGRWFDLGLAELRAEGVEAFVLALIGQIRETGFTGMLGSFLWGGLIVSSAVGAVAGLIAWAVARSGHVSDAWHEVANRVAVRYVRVTLRDAEGARERLLDDPIFPFLVQEAAFVNAGRLLDLGCGRGVVAALAAESLGRPPAFSYVGVDRAERYVRAAREALDGEPGFSFVAADLRDFDPPPADVALLLNVLRFLPVDSQDALLRRLGKALPPGGRLYVREIDAGGGWRASLARASETFSLLFRGRAIGGRHPRRASDLRNALAAAGFEVRDRTTLHGVSPARVLFEAVRRPAALR